MNEADIMGIFPSLDLNYAPVLAKSQLPLKAQDSHPFDWCTCKTTTHEAIEWTDIAPPVS